MGEDSKIAWTHHTFNPWWGCARVSPGCEHCYAEQLAVVRRKLPVWGPNADRKAMSEAYWRQPVKWNRDAERAGERRRVFCASMADVFEMPKTIGPTYDMMRAARFSLWAIIERTPWLDWLLLTKRPEEVSASVPWGEDTDDLPWPSNVWLGVTAEDQRRADERIPILLSIPARVRFVSYEPALEAVDFGRWLRGEPSTACECGHSIEEHVPECTECECIALDRAEAVSPDLSWIIVGGESGPKARPFDLAWARSVVRQCKAARVACFVKQLGAHPLDGLAGRFEVTLPDPKGGDPAEWPADLRVREFPKGGA